MSSPLSIVVTANIGDAKRQLSELRGELNQLNEAAKGGVKVEAKTDGKSLVAQLRKEQEEIKASAAIAVAAEKTKQTEMRISSKATQENAKSLSKMRHETVEAADSQGILSKNVQGARYALYQIAAAYGAASAATLGFTKASLESSISQEKAFAQVARTTEATSAQLKPLRDTLREISTEIPESFEELSKIAQLGGQMGFAASELGAFTETVAKFAASTGVSVEASATAFGKLSNLLHVGIEDFEALGSAIAQVGVTTVATDAQIIKTASELAGVGYQAKMTTEGVIGLAAAFASLDIQPERARSSVLRFFRNIDLGLAQGGDALKNWTIQLGMSIDEIKELRNSDADAFFARFIKSLQDSSEAGENLAEIFDKLNIDQVRDVDAFSRLAGGYQLLADAVEEANIAYAKATFLTEASEKIFSTVSAQIDRMRNAWDNFKAGVGDTQLLNKPLQGLIFVMSKILEGLDALGPGFKAALGTFTLLIGLFTAYKAAIALAMAGTLAFRYVFQNGMSASGISMRGLRTEIQNTRAAMKDNAVVASQTSNSNVAGVQREIAARTALTGAIRNQSVATSGLAVPGSVGPAAGGAGAAGGVAARGVGTFLKSFAGFAVISLATSAIVGVTEAIIDAGRASEREAQRVAEFQQGMIDLAGGASAFREALDEDNAALKANASSVDDLTGSMGRMFTRYTEVAGEINKVDVTRVFEDASGAMHDLSTETVTTVGNAGDFIDAMAGIEGATRDANGEVINQVRLMGDLSDAWVRGMIQNAIMAKDSEIDAASLLGVEDLLQALQDVKKIPDEDRIHIEDVLFTSVTENKAAAMAMIQPFLDEMQAQLDAFYLQAIEQFEALNGKLPVADKDVETGFPGNRIIPSQVQGQIAQLYETIAGDLPAKFASITGAVNDFSGALGEAGAQAEVASRFAKDAGDEAEEAGDKWANAAEDVNTLAEQLDEASKAFQEFMGTITQQADLTADLANSYEALGKSIAENGGSFDVMTEAGRNNLSAFEGVMNAYGAIIDAEIQAGRMTAEQGAQMMAVYMSDLVAQLGRMKVPDEQIKALVGMLNKVTGFGWKISIGADVSSAIAGINSVAAAANMVASGVRASGINLLSGAGISAFWQGAKAYAGETNFAPASTDTFNDAMLGGYNSALDKAAGAGKKAGKTIEDAMKDAEKATKDMETAFKNAADTFANFGKTAFSHINAEGKVFETLRDLGVSLAENGKHFNTYSDAGRANLKALEDAFIAYGEQQRTQLESGEIGFKRAQKNMQSFAQQVYQDLRNAGVPAKEINRIFRAMGVDTKNIEKASKDVKVFKDVLNVANQAAKGTAKSVKELKEETEDYVKRLKDGFDEVNQSIFGRQNAADATAQAFNRMSDAIKAVNDEIQRLKDESQDYGTIIAGQEAIAQGAGVAYAQALANGDPELAALYGYRRDTAQAQANEARRQQQERANQIAELEASKNATKGNTDAAIDNRRALQDLMTSYQDQIIALAQTGASQKKVQAFADSTKQSFIDQAKELGFTEDQLKVYTDSFDRLVTTVKDTPKKVKIDVELTGAEAADKAVKDLLKSNDKLKVTPELKDKKPFRQAMKDLTKGWEAYVKARRDKASADKVVQQMKNGPAATRTATIKASVDPVSFSNAKNKLDSLKGSSTYTVDIRGATGKASVVKFNQGGLIGFASGGRVPGTPPINPYEDNVLARSPGGLFALRSGEYVQSQPAVDYYGLPFMNAINEMRIPRENIAGLTKAISGLNTAQVASTGNITVVANYPQAEPTSKTINRARELATGMGAL